MELYLWTYLWLDENPAVAATIYHGDKHVVKMILKQLFRLLTTTTTWFVDRISQDASMPGYVRGFEG